MSHSTSGVGGGGGTGVSLQYKGTAGLSGVYQGSPGYIMAHTRVIGGTVHLQPPPDPPQLAHCDAITQHDDNQNFQQASPSSNVYYHKY